MLRNLIQALRFSGCVILAAGLGASVSCTKKTETPPAVPAASPVVPAPVVESPPVPQTEFSDPALQSRYEAEFTQLVDKFTPPSTGSLMAVRLTDGSFIGGAMARLNPTGIILKLGKQEFVASRPDMESTQQADLYRDAFARQYAMAEVTAPVATNLATVPTRYALKEILDTFTGPSPRYPRVPDLQIAKGTRIDVKQRRGRWLLATAPTVKPGTTFWVDFFETIPLNDDPNADNMPFMLLLLEQGILMRIDPEQSEAFVSEEAWAGTEPAVQEGISRLLAAHCAQVKKSSVVWVDIKGDQSNKRLARFSRAQGYRTF